MGKTVRYGSFEWDDEKDRGNRRKHGLEFETAVLAFGDHHRVIAADELHSGEEERLFCIGLVNNKVATVRFTYRHGRIRIIGAGYWRKGRELYEKQRTRR
jgi:uncharacterized DUF497 family protein